MLHIGHPEHSEGSLVFSRLQMRDPWLRLATMTVATQSQAGLRLFWFVAINRRLVPPSIHNSQLFEESRIYSEKLDATNQRLQRSLKELSRLYTALAPLSPAESVNDMLDGIVERLLETTGAESALIRLEDREKGGLFLVGQRGFPDYYLKAVASPPAGSALEWVSKTGKPIITVLLRWERCYQERLTVSPWSMTITISVVSLPRQIS